jgi:type I toxin-antitoxin system toxin SymE
MKRKSRKLAVEEFMPSVPYPRRQPRPAAQVRLKGQWLIAAGFPVGTSVLVTVISPGVIELRLDGIRARDGEYLIAADRLDVAIAKDKARKEAKP